MTVFCAALMLAVAAGCADDDRQPAERSSEDATTATDVSAAPTTSSAVQEPGTAAGTDAPSAKARSTNAPASAPSTTGPAGTMDTGSQPTDAQASGATTLAPAQPGSYRYAVSGSYRTTAGTRQPPPEAFLVIDPPQGADQREARDGGGGQGSQETVVRYGPDGVLVVRSSISSPQGSKEFRPDPPVLQQPWPTQPGRQWSWQMKSTDGLTTVKGDFEVLRTEAVDVGGQMVDCVVVQGVVATSGDFTSTSRMTTWWSPEHRLVAQRHTKTDGTFGGQRFTGDITEKLASTTPA